VEPEILQIDPDEPFRFACDPQVPCFNACCRELNQFLTPYDILRLKTALGLSSGDFLRRFTRTHIGPQTGLPVVSLVPGDARRRTCPFLTRQGCRVYADRPASCRTYPLMRIVRRCRETGRVTEEFMLLKEPHCLGFEAAAQQTPREWIQNQGAGRYNRFNDLMMAVIRVKNRRSGHTPPGPQVLRHLRLALYDLDAFRLGLQSGGFSGRPEADPELLAAAIADDESLLKVGIQQAVGLLTEDR
jgi:Fe-S-cluster containining protein